MYNYNMLNIKKQINRKTYPKIEKNEDFFVEKMICFTCEM